MHEYYFELGRVHGSAVEIHTVKGILVANFFTNLVVRLRSASSVYAGSGAICHVAEPVRNLYLVELDATVDDVPALAKQLTKTNGGTVRLVFQNASTGFSATLTEAQAAVIARAPFVSSVEEVARVHESSEQVLPQIPPNTSGSLWNLDRIDQGTATPNYRYDYCERGGGVTVYVIGNGVYRDHDQFRTTSGTSRVLRGAKYTTENCIAPGDSADYGYWPCGSGTMSAPLGTGHDTAVASIIGGKDYGVAKSVTIVPVRFIDSQGNGTTEGAAWAFDWIMTACAAGQSTGCNPYRNSRPAVVNWSDGFFTKDPFGGDDVRPTFVENEINKILGKPYVNGVCYSTPTTDPNVPALSRDWNGIAVIVSANNQNSRQSYTSPARMAYGNAPYFGSCGRVISVGGTDENDARWVCNPSIENPCLTAITYQGTTVTAGSNYGYTVDIFAPAHFITAAWNRTTTDTVPQQQLRSGTSWAAPIVTGLAARALVVQPSLTPDQLWNSISTGALWLPTAIDPVTGNNKLAYRFGQSFCNPERP